MSDANSNPLVHLVTGSTGAGKTSYAIELSKKRGAVRFSIDEWMGKLYWMDSPRPAQYEWAIERIARCEELIAATVRQLGALGIASVLDLGFTRADHRARFAKLALECNLPVQLHYLKVSKEERWRRVIERNSTRGATYEMNVDRGMFDFMEGIWEPPDTEEMQRLNGVLISDNVAPRSRAGS